MICSGLVPIILRWLFFASLLFVWHCSSSRRSTSDDTLAERRGLEAAMESLEKFDALPSFSGDGQYLIFISGREKALHAYWVDVSSEQPDEVKRLTQKDSGFTQEYEAILSHDGLFAVVLAERNGQQGLFVIKRDGGVILAEIIDKSSIFNKMALSSDSRILAIEKTDLATKRRFIELRILENGVPTGDKLVLDQQEKKDELHPVFLTNSSSSYQLVVRERLLTAFYENLKVYTLSLSGSSIAINAREVVEEKVLLVPDKSYHQLGNGLLILERLKNDSSRQIKALGPFAQDNQTVIAKNQIRYLSNLASKDSEIIDVPSYEIISLTGSRAANDPIVIAIGHNVFACKENETSYGSLLYMADISQKQVHQLSIRTADDEKTRWEVDTEDPCRVTRLDGGSGDLDRSMMDAVVAASSTADSYKVAYVSLFYGNNDVMLLRYLSGEYTIFNISKTE